MTNSPTPQSAAQTNEVPQFRATHVPETNAAPTPQGAALPGVLVAEVKATGRGSDYYGPCDCCGGKNVSETFKVKTWIEYRGKRYKENSEAYGHQTCIEKRAVAINKGAA